ncbi:hypothetical protein CVT24_006791 [Panaeolus cyanescens]|uniref:MYND-type domain-containing protein n=1 Tax=Panaeolus cyanescens TaxID=181874 RepID=A0A409V9B3_9AGAR|nr:hypothetical protein CVT24_006791 [Panaeolus cyanescens]
MALQNPASADATGRPRKKARQELTDDLPSTSKSKIREPRLFAPFRALGLITNHVPFVLQARSHKGATDGPKLHLLTCLGRSWALWEGGKMGLLFVGPDAPDFISSMAMDGDAVWVASGIHLIKYIRGKEVLRASNPLGGNLSFITVFGSQILALTESGDRLLLWNTSNAELDGTITFDPSFTAKSILHPATYLNKVIVGSVQGDIQLWNIQTQTCIHRFEVNRLLSIPKSRVGQRDEGYTITSMVQSPAIDVVGVGYSSGEISIYDIRADERLMKMFMEGGNITALGFRTDGHPVLASASSAGHVALWDLNERGRLLHMIKGAHDGAISALEWVPGQPVLITSGDDNSVKQWLFDSPTAPPRLLKFRSGHHAPPHLIRYYGDDGKQLLTASRDRSLRCTSVVRDSRSFELSQGMHRSLLKKATSLSIPLASLKFPPISSISYSKTRSKDWDDILTCHSDEILARTWTMQNKKLGKYTFSLADAQKKGKDKKATGTVKTVCVTACGNFGLAGSSTGEIHMWNMQSGIKRKSFTLGSCPQEVVARFYAGTAKRSDRAISGIATDSLNRLVIASTLDGTINFFDFLTTKLEHTLVLPSTAISILLQRDSGLLAVVCDDMTIRIVDIETRKVVRELKGFHSRILDITFSADSRWLVASSLDSVIRTFDIPTGRLIDGFRTSSVATSISFSPTNDFLATAHVDSVGVFLWANRSQYAEISFSSVSDDDIFEVSMPSMQGIAEDEALEALEALKVADSPADVFSTPPQLDGDLITLTLLPRSRWQTLLNLEVIEQRNKPKEPPKAPEQAPFFLPTLPGVETRFAIEDKTASAQSQKPTKRLQKVADGSRTTFEQLLYDEPRDGDYERLFNHAKILSPAALDLEIRSLTGLEALSLFIHALTRRLLSHRDFEAVQAMQNVFIKTHGEILIQNEELLSDLEELAATHRKESQGVLQLIASSLGTLGFHLNKLTQAAAFCSIIVLCFDHPTPIMNMDMDMIETVVTRIYSSPHVPTADNFAEVMGLTNTDGVTTSAFVGLDEAAKLIVCCHLLRKLRMSVNVREQDIVYHKFAALYLPALVINLLDPPPLPEGAPPGLIDDFKLNNCYIEILGTVSHTPYFAKFIRSKTEIAEGSKKLIRTITQRLIDVAPSWDRKMLHTPIDREEGYYQSAAGTAIQLLSTLHAAFIKEPAGSPILLTPQLKKDVLPWLRKWESRHRSEFLGQVCMRTRSQLLGHADMQRDARQIRRLLKNWEVCGNPGCEKNANLKACSRCQTVRYCCPEHQKAHWSNLAEPHKSLCYKADY